MLGHGIHICIGILKMKLYHHSHYHKGGTKLDTIRLNVSNYRLSLCRLLNI